MRPRHSLAHRPAVRAALITYRTYACSCQAHCKRRFESAAAAAAANDLPSSAALLTPAPQRPPQAPARPSLPGDGSRFLPPLPLPSPPGPPWATVLLPICSFVLPACRLHPQTRRLQVCAFERCRNLLWQRAEDELSELHEAAGLRAVGWGGEPGEWRGRAQGGARPCCRAQGRAGEGWGKERREARLMRWEGTVVGTCRVGWGEGDGGGASHWETCNCFAPRHAGRPTYQQQRNRRSMPTYPYFVAVWLGGCQPPISHQCLQRGRLHEGAAAGQGVAGQGTHTQA